VTIVAQTMLCLTLVVSNSSTVMLNPNFTQEKTKTKQ
jgi:hypothetical protein